MKKKIDILITGGAGYIGSHLLLNLLENTKLTVLVIDNLSLGSSKIIKDLKKIRFFYFEKLDINDEKKLNKIYSKFKVDTIIHLASNIIVSESFKNPIKYYLNNLSKSINFFNCSIRNKVNKFIFSSTAAVYDSTKSLNIGFKENSNLNPNSPYGKTKLFFERLIKDYSYTNKNFKYAILRYFNVAGADMHYTNKNLSPRIGQVSKFPTHIIKKLCQSSIYDKPFNLNGNNFKTKDGTCIRDYIHVVDLSDIHYLVFKKLRSNNQNIELNCGYGIGYSNLEIIKNFQKISEKKIKIKIKKRRLGDEAILFSNSNKLKKYLSWKPKYNDLNKICHSALKWEKKLKKKIKYY